MKDRFASPPSREGYRRSVLQRQACGSTGRCLSPLIGPSSATVRANQPAAGQGTTNASQWFLEIAAAFFLLPYATASKGSVTDWEVPPLTVSQVPAEMSGRAFGEVPENQVSRSTSSCKMARLKILDPVVLAELMLQISMEVVALHNKGGY